VDVVDAVRKSSTLSVDGNAETDLLTSIFPMSEPAMLETLEDPETRIHFAWTAPGKNPSSRAPTMANRFGGLVSRVMAGASPYNMGAT